MSPAGCLKPRILSMTGERQLACNSLADALVAVEASTPGWPVCSSVQPLRRPSSRRSVPPPRSWPNGDLSRVQIGRFWEMTSPLASLPRRTKARTTREGSVPLSRKSNCATPARLCQADPDCARQGYASLWKMMRLASGGDGADGGSWGPGEFGRGLDGRQVCLSKCLFESSHMSNCFLFLKNENVFHLFPQTSDLNRRNPF